MVTRYSLALRPADVWAGAILWRGSAASSELGRSMLRPGGWRVQLELERGTFGPWSRERSREQVLTAFGHWDRPFDRARFRVGRGPDGDVRILRVVRVEIMTAPSYPGGTVASDVMGALFARAAPRMTFAGCLVCKRVNGAPAPAPWSQHAYGKAVNWSAANLPAAQVAPTNAACTRWALRMGRAGQLPGHEVIGTLDGHAVVNASSPGWQVQPGGDPSHLFHTHVSTGSADSTGLPACAR